MAGDVTRKRSSGRRATPARFERIVDEATAIAASDGPAAVTMQAVAVATGFVRPVVYDCFADRDELIDCVVERAASSVRRRLRAVDEHRSGARVGLEAGVLAYLDVLLEDPREWRLFLQPTDGAGSRVAATMLGVREDLRASVQRWIDDAWPHAVDSEAASVSVLGAIDGLGLRVADDPANCPRSRVESMLATIASNAVVR